MRALLDALPADYVPPASGLEGRFVGLLRDFDLPAMRRQVDLGDGERWCGRVDFVAVDVPLVIEVDSERYHTALSDVAADEARQARLERAGFVVRRVDEFDVWHRPHMAAARVRDGYWAARRRAA
jgi:very-short-patch-repair endonuclease